MRLPMHLKTILIGVAVVAVSFLISLKAMDWLAPRGTVRPPALVELPPLPPAPRSSTVMAPVVGFAVGDPRRRRSRRAAQSFAGKADNPVSQILQNADIGWTASRGPIAATGAQDVLSLTTPLTGTLNVTGSLSVERRPARSATRSAACSAATSPSRSAASTSRTSMPAPRSRATSPSPRGRSSPANWRIEPNLAAQVNLGDTSLSVAGARVNVPAQVKPLIDKTVADQINAVQARMRNDPALRTERAGAMGQGLPLDPAAGHRRRLVAAGAVAGDAADPRDRGAAARRCAGA